MRILLLLAMVAHVLIQVAKVLVDRMGLSAVNLSQKGRENIQKEE
jgi:hypothetical protein